MANTSKMDLADMIVGAAATQLKKECLSNKCVISICMHNRYIYVIEVISLTNHIILKYKSLEYKILRQNKDEYNEIVTFLVDEIVDADEIQVNEDIEFNGYWPNNDDAYHENSVTVKRNDEKVFYKPIKEVDLSDVVGKYLKSLRLIN